MERENAVNEDGYDFGARLYNSWNGKWISVDPLASKYPHLSPYAFVAGNPINLVDEDGLEPIDPRTGKPISLNLFRAAVYDADYIDYAKLTVVRDDDLYDNANPWIKRERGKPDGMWDGVVYNIHKSNFQHTSASAKQALGGLFPSVQHPGADYGSPNDAMWRNVAEKGTYLFLDDRYSESEVFHINQTSFNIMTVEQNYITQIVNLTRSDGNGQFNINSVTTFNIQKGDVQTREVGTWWGGTRTEKYRTLTVTETSQQYKNNEATGSSTSKTYTREEVIN
jgi:RHS repeat-associated protein